MFALVAGPLGAAELNCHGPSNVEDATGERVLLLLLGIATLFSAVFLLLPFVAIRRTWTKLPRKGRSALYFASLGLGFMFFEITLIQRLVLFPRPLKNPDGTKAIGTSHLQREMRA